VVTIIIGYLLERANLSRSALWVTIAHLVVTAAVFGGLEANKWISSRKDSKYKRTHNLTLTFYKVAIPSDV
jgi:hypothetical protein